MPKTRKPFQTATASFALRLIAAMAAVSTATSAIASQAATLEVRVEGLRTPSGMVRLALCNSRTCYQSQMGFFRMADVPVQEEEVVISLPDLPPGEYALTMYHDENGNGTFDRSFIGFPEEGFGFSRDAKPVFEKPIYDSVVVTVGEDDMSITMTMQYW